MGMNMGSMNLIKMESQESTIGVAYFFLEYVRNFNKEISDKEVESFLKELDCKMSTVQLYNEVILKFYPNFQLIQTQEPVVMLDLIEKDNESVYLSYDFIMNIKNIETKIIRDLSSSFGKRRKLIRIPCTFLGEMYGENTNKEKRMEVDIKAWGEIMLHPYKIGKIKKRRDFWELEITIKSLKKKE